MNTENKCIAVAGLLLLGIMLMGGIIDISSRSSKPATCVNTSKLEYNDTRGTENLPILNSKPMYHYSLEVITQAEDEYWEIEKLGDNFYRVRREDCDEDLYGRYEFDSEELIGDVESLYKYAKDHHIIHH